MIMISETHCHRKIVHVSRRLKNGKYELELRTSLSKHETDQWQFYILYLVDKRMISTSILNLYQMLGSMEKTYPCTSKNQFPDQDLKKDQIKWALYVPCHIISFSSYKYITDSTWNIYIHSSFIVNVSIDHGYVSYSESCIDDRIDVFDQNLEFMSNVRNKLKYALREIFCGYVYKESVYSTGRSIGLRIVATDQRAVQIPFLQASYQIHNKGFAFRHGKLSKHDTSNLVSYDIELKMTHTAFNLNNVQQVYFLQETMHYVMYMLNAKGEKSSLSVLTFQCEQPASKLSIFPGMLNMYMMMFDVESTYTLNCIPNNNTTKYIYALDFHAYSTILVSISSYDKAYFIHMVCTLVKNMDEFKYKDQPTFVIQSRGNSFISHTFQSSIHRSWVIKLFSNTGPLSMMRSGIRKMENGMNGLSHLTKMNSDFPNWLDYHCDLFLQLYVPLKDW